MNGYTDYGRMRAIFKILYNQYYFWDIGRTNVNYVRLWMDFGNHGQGTHSALKCKMSALKCKMCADSLAKNTPNTPTFIWTICPIGKKSSGYIWKKRLYWASSFREWIWKMCYEKQLGPGCAYSAATIQLWPLRKRGLLKSVWPCMLWIKLKL